MTGFAPALTSSNDLGVRIGYRFITALWSITLVGLMLSSVFSVPPHGCWKGFRIGYTNFLNDLIRLEGVGKSIVGLVSSS